MSLREQAVRLKRTRWPDSNLLAQEMFLILLQAIEDPDIGPVQIDLGNGQPPVAVRPDNFKDPFGNFIIPNLDDLDLDQLHTPNRETPGWQQNPLILNLYDIQQDDPTSPDGQDQPKRFQRVRTYNHPVGPTVLPGKIVSGGPGDTYVMRLYPNGKNNANGSFLATVTQLDIDPAEVLPADAWAPVFGGSSLLTIQVTETVETVPGVGGERVVSMSLKISRATGGSGYFCQFPVYM